MSNPDDEKLREYRRKRSADATPEPFGRGAPRAGRTFVVHHHAARAVHYDLRLELGGVLMSWAVPKGPSPNPADKRLAVKVEDHPLEYGSFEGLIPEGNYGAGASIVWDRGIWIAEKDPVAGLEKGKLLFTLRGYKLRGKWTLVKTTRSEKDWLLIKERDNEVREDAGTGDYPAGSVLSGLAVDELANAGERAKPINKALKKLKAPRKAVRPDDIKVMLAQPAEPFTRDGWLFEVKYDGYRMIAVRDGDNAKLVSRNHNDMTASFPEIARVIRALPFDRFILDGEVVVHDPRGLPDFGLLQKRGGLSRSIDVSRACVELPASFYTFDLLAFGDYDVRPVPLYERKALLEAMIPAASAVRFVDHIGSAGETMYQHAAAMGLEGIMAKRADAPYQGARSADWLKMPVRRTEDFAIAGFTPPRGSQPGLGALLLVQYKDGVPSYSGRVGSGIPPAKLKELADTLKAMPPAKPPTDAPNEPGWRWVDPQLVCEVEYKERTRDGQLRQPVFKGLRDDKMSAECVFARHDLPEPKVVDDKSAAEPLRLTNRDKIFWPESRYTKGDLLDYYRDVSGWMLPYLKDRPVVLTRYPDGIAGKSFFQKDAPDFVPDWIRREMLYSEGADREIRYIVIDSVEALLYVVNMGSIPLHIWASRVDTLEQPDWCVLDLDPKDAPFTDVVKIARTIHKLCDEIGLDNFVKTTGSTGLHVLIPLGAKYTYEQSRSLGELLANVVCREHPDIATVARALSAREGKVYIDFLQNGHGKTIVAPFSARPKPGAPVAMPVNWNQVTARLTSTRFTIKNATKALKKRPMNAPELKAGPDLAKVLGKLAKVASSQARNPD